MPDNGLLLLLRRPVLDRLPDLWPKGQSGGNEATSPDKGIRVIPAAQQMAQQGTAGKTASKSQQSLLIAVQTTPCLLQL